MFDLIFGGRCPVGDKCPDGVKPNDCPNRDHCLTQREMLDKDKIERNR